MGAKTHGGINENLSVQDPRKIMANMVEGDRVHNMGSATESFNEFLDELARK